MNEKNSGRLLHVTDGLMSKPQLHGKASEAPVFAPLSTSNGGASNCPPRAASDGTQRRRYTDTASRRDRVIHPALMHETPPALTLRERGTQ